MNLLSVAFKVDQIFFPLPVKPGNKGPCWWQRVPKECHHSVLTIDALMFGVSKNFSHTEKSLLCRSLMLFYVLMPSGSDKTAATDNINTNLFSDSCFFLFFVFFSGFYREITAVTSCFYHNWKDSGRVIQRTIHYRWECGKMYVRDFGLEISAATSV